MIHSMHRVVLLDDGDVTLQADRLQLKVLGLLQTGTVHFPKKFAIFADWEMSPIESALENIHQASRRSIGAASST